MKNIAYLLLFFILTSANTTAQASTLAGGSGWRVASTVANGIGVTVNGAKDVIVNGAKKTVTGVANVTPTASQVGKFMGKNLGAAAVIGAMDLLLDGVDYVLDPANNSVQYKTKSDPNNKPMCYSNQGVSSTCFGSMAIAAAAALAYDKSQYPSYEVVSYTIDNKTVYLKNQAGQIKNIYTFGYVANPNYDPEAAAQENQSKSVPLVNLGSQVLEQAETEVKTGNPAVPIATPVTQAAATAVVGEAATDDVQARPIVTELDKSAVYPTTEDATGTIDTPAVTDPATGELVKPAESSSIKLSFPKACEWFPQACLFIDWMMQEYQEEDPPELPKEEMELKEIDQDLINLNASSCPAPLDVSIALPMFNTTYNDSIDISEYCTKLEDLAPVLQLISIVIAVMILARI